MRATEEYLTPKQRLYMDAAEHDPDAKLYKASGNLLQEIKIKLPQLIYHHNRSPPTPRLFVLDSKCEELRSLLDRFQEWPQLLDPHLSEFVQLLATAFVDYLANSSNHYSKSIARGSSGISPLPRAVCRLLYSLCKVRGYKVIVRLLNNEPKYLAPMLSKFRTWSNGSFGMTWEERYIIMLWLSHLMLAPFELSTMSLDNTVSDVDVPAALARIPNAPGNVISLALQQLESSGKEREAASVLLVRLSLRTDMQAHKVASVLVGYAVERLLQDHDLLKISPYKALGLLSLIYGIMNASSDSEGAPLIQPLFRSVLELATSRQTSHTGIRDSAPSRKLILKILRSVLTHGMSLNATLGTVSDDFLTTMLEESIQHFLDALKDKDTPVRMAAAKALSVVVLKLSPGMSREVIDAILSSLEESVFLEDPTTQKLVPITDQAKSDSIGLKRNISAVDPLQWHGLMLTLGHLLFRRSPPPDMLPEIIRALILGLEFEQRSNVGTSVGIGVRDAACFGLWALARKYSTTELGLLSISNFAEAAQESYAECKSVLQLIAIKLAISACFDPSGNIRRGSSAALQELIGRHPDTIVHGIPVVQIVDYHAIARLSRAMTEVASQLAALDQVYHRPLLQALVEWRGARATDVNQRRWAADAISRLTKSAPIDVTFVLIHAILQQLFDLKPANIGSTATARNGLLLALTSAVESATHSDSVTTKSWFMKQEHGIFMLPRMTGKMDVRVTADLELVMEGISAFAGTMCRSFKILGSNGLSVQQEWLTAASEILNQCTVAGVKDAVVQASSEANLDLFKVLSSNVGVELIEKWLDSQVQAPAAFTSKGRIKTLSLIHAHLAKSGLHSKLQQSIASYAIGIVRGSYNIETRVDAMEALGVIILNSDLSSPTEAEKMAEVLCCGLDDYTNDQRGDIGSMLRLQSIETLDAYRKGSSQPSEVIGEAVLPYVAKLASEKLLSVRFRAWKCLEGYWRTSTSLPELEHTFDYPTDVSTISYFLELLKLLEVSTFHQHLLRGFVSSATAGTEDICRAASNAFVAYMQRLDGETRERMTEKVSSMILDQLAQNALQDDRQVVPLLHFLCFLLDQDLLIESSTDMWAIMKNVHSPNSSLPRIEAAMNCYARMLAISHYQKQAMDKLTRQLLHRWPKVRNDAADLLYFETGSTMLATVDWNATLTKTKPVALDLRKQFGVSGIDTSKQ
ncbi:hypothetical protein PV08_01598 [Exophiala spinifera]|uniref:Uncharacterized protein n=1 Tax=Exophiala spinifera TaxID=91928 RepID=A0A0D2CC37_9EURO|nr:uncharacterized protein PV08_01598 [Exophiala spinifera]KIW21019.1 hypothetical protein PV08_01598 [Exophiala spinifera]